MTAKERKQEYTASEIWTLVIVAVFVVVALVYGAIHRGTPLSEAVRKSRPSPSRAGAPPKPKPPQTSEVEGSNTTRPAERGCWVMRNQKSSPSASAAAYVVESEAWDGDEAPQALRDGLELARRKIRELR